MNKKRKYPISVQSFEKIREEGYLYVDKTSLVWDLAQFSTCFLCRPRRFGKSLLVSTLEAYFKGRKELFTGLAIEEKETKWLEYPVFHIDFSSGNFKAPGELEKNISEYLAVWESHYGSNPFNNTLSSRFRYVLEQAYIQTGRKAVVLIDEYDKPLLDVIGETIEEDNRNILRGLYSTFKSVDSSLRFVLLTGVTKFSQVSVFSGFNQPYDLSMDPAFDALCGITEKELDDYFGESITNMAKSMGETAEVVKTMLKQKYDGYHFSEQMLDIYNPFSLINAFQSGRLDNFWFRSGTPEYLVKLLANRDTDITKLTSQFFSTDYFIDYRADIEDPLAMLYQSGYLTIKEYEPEDLTYRLDFPNTEVRRGFMTFLANDYFGSSSSTDSFIRSLRNNLRNGNIKEVMDGFTSFFASIPYSENQKVRAKDYEGHYQYTMSLIIRMLTEYVTVTEKQNSHGRADLVVETPDYIYIFEFKLDGNIDEALLQIEEKGYAQPYIGDPRKLLKVGVNMSRSTGTVQD